MGPVLQFGSFAEASPITNRGIQLSISEYLMANWPVATSS
jgi:hypothetical protein